MNTQCPFCHALVVKINLSRLDLRICPNCFSTFFPSDKTMTFRSELFPYTRRRWLQILESKMQQSAAAEVEKNVERNVENSMPVEPLKCIDHGQVLTDSKFPDYGIDGKMPSCCGMFHLSASQTAEILRRTLAGSDADFFTSRSPRKEKHHFAIIKMLDKLVSKLLDNNKMPAEDPLEKLQYELHFRKVLEGGA